MADPVPPSPPADQASPEETYARLEREYHARRLPPHHFYHTEHARLKQEYESLSASYLQTLELWPGYAKRHRLLEDLMETTRAGIRDYSSPAKRYTAHLQHLAANKMDPPSHRGPFQYDLPPALDHTEKHKMYGAALSKVMDVVDPSAVVAGPLMGAPGRDGEVEVGRDP